MKNVAVVACYNSIIETGSRLGQDFIHVLYKVDATSTLNTTLIKDKDMT